MPEALALEIPDQPEGYVSDYAGLLSAPVETRLEQFLALFEQRTSNQIFIAVFPSLENESLEDFSIRLAEAWKPGQAGRDNGVLFVVFRDDRRMRIETGYGLEGALPDALAGQIIRQLIVPYFQRGEYEAGILAGVQGIVKAIEGEYEGRSTAPSTVQRGLSAEERASLERQGRILVLFALAFAAVIFIVDLVRYRQYLTEHRLYRDRYSFWEWFFRFALLLAILYFLFRMLFYALLFSRGGTYGGRGGFGGFRGGGGGGFGGGGASGGW